MPELPEGDTMRREMLSIVGRERYVPLALLVALCLWNVGVQGFGFIDRAARYSPLFYYGYVGMLWAQPVLCGFWAAWSVHPLKWRLPLAFASVTLLVVACSLNRDSLRLLLASYMLLAATLALLFSMHHALSYTISSTSAFEPSSPPRERPHFNLRYLFFWTTVIAIFAAVFGLNALQFDTLNLQGNLWLTTWASFAVLVFPVVACCLHFLTSDFH